MAPLIILGSCWVMFGFAGQLGVRPVDSWAKAGRAALAVMFVFTGATHFSSMKHDYLAMMPGPFPRSLGMIYVTGALEIAGAVGLLIPRLRRWAAAGLLLFLVAVFPANVNAALNEIPFRGGPPTSLWVRTPVQLAFMISIWWSVFRSDAAERDPQ